MRKICVWNEEYTDEESLYIIKDLALQHAHLGGPEGERIAACITNSDYRSLCDWTVDYSPERSTSELVHIRQALGFFQKYEPLPLGIDREAVAFVKFQSAESQCRETNIIFRKQRLGEFYFPHDVESCIFRAQQKIAEVLGDVPKLSELRLRFGKGATTRTNKRDASPRRKLGDGISCSKELFRAAPAVLRELPHFASLHGDVDSRTVAVETGSLSFVPKNAKTFRAIVVEPVLNGLCQLGIESILTKRLAAFGVDLRDQTHNQELARVGSLTSDLATLDLSSASDTISRELVASLLPLDWYSFLSIFRTGTVSYKGKPFEMEKFSSMGNGFTFPLESLIFWALTKACCAGDETVSIYGDDIICPSHRVPLVTRVLTACGFSINTEKSYWVGYFRESCGADFFRGFDIRPAYVKTLVSPASLFVLHNFYVRHGDIEFADYVKTLLHESLKIFGPDGYGDGHLIGDWHPRPHKRNLGYSGYLFDTFSLRGRRDTRPAQPGDYVYSLYSIYMADFSDIKISERVPFGCSPLGGLRVSIRDPSGDVSIEGVPTPSLPGTKGYKRISIYTLTSR